jgi:phosphate transport system permease protein
MAVITPPRPSAAPVPPTSGGLGSGTRPPGIVTDRVFRWIALASGLTVLVVLALIAYSTIEKAWPWFRAEGLDAVLSDSWNPAGHTFGGLALVYGTLLVGVIALVLAVPVSLGIALFVNEIAPAWLRRPIVYTVDLLAAVPSVVYGLWAIFVLRSPMADLGEQLASWTSGVPVVKELFGSPSATGQSYAIAGVVVAMMITPIITSIVREVVATTPASLKEAAFGLGATRWEMVRGAVFPHSRGGIVSAVMIGLGRAVGETIAVFLVIGSSQHVSEHLFGPGDTMASVIAGQFGEATGTHRAALIGLGVVLFAMTVIIGMSARVVVARYDRKMGVR